MATYPVAIVLYFFDNNGREKVSKMPDKESNIVGWLDELKRYARAFYDKICSTDEEFKNIVKYDEDKFEKVFEKYKVYRASFHHLIDSEFIDRHKILAGIMFAATDKENLIFEIDDEAIKRSSKNDFPYWVLFPNEYYLCTILLRILTDFILVTKKSEKYGLAKKKYDVRFPDNIVWWEKGEIEPYTNQFCQLLTTLIRIDDDITVKYSLLASHLFYFYELAYDCAVEGFNSTYYDITV
jgi:hypothetical protein